MKKHVRTASKVFAWALIFCMILPMTACQNQSTPTDQNNPGAESSVKPEKLTIALSGDVVTMDPQVPGGTPSETVKSHIFETLINMEEDGSFSPCLATSWENEGDGSSWVFQLREDVKFHDGSDMTAEDVVATYKRLINREYGSTRIGDFPGFINAEAIDTYTVRLYTDGPVGNFLNLLTYGGGQIMSSEAIESYKDEIGQNVIGTGPYKLVDYASGDHAEVTVNENYWGEIPQIKTLYFAIVPESSTRANMLLTGEAGFVLDVEVNDVDRINSSGTASVRYDETNRVAQIGFNMAKEPFSNSLVRQAMNYAVDKDIIISGVMGGAAVATNNVVAPNVFGYVDGEYIHDTAKAKALLAEAGYPDGFSVTLWTPQGRYYKDKETCLAVAAQLAEIGITVNVEVRDWASYLSELKVPMDEGNQVEMYMLGWECYTREAGYSLGALFSKASIPPNGWNTMFYVNEELEDLIVEIRQTIDSDARLQLIEKALKMVSADAPWIPLYTYSMLCGESSGLEGVYILPTQLPRFEKAHFS